MAPMRVALSAFALLAGAAASSAAAQAPAVAGATTDDAPNPSTLADAALVDPKPADTTSTADRRALAKKRGCNPKKNTSCCRAPRRPPPAALGEIYPADMPTPSARHPPRSERSTLLICPLLPPPSGR
jgi:hypothetical protein